jgi:hypothetical protein
MTASGLKNVITSHDLHFSYHPESIGSKTVSAHISDVLPCGKHVQRAVPAGSYWTGSALAACPSNTFSDTVRPVSNAASCEPCPQGLYTNGTTGNKGCSE